MSSLGPEAVAYFRAEPFVSGIVFRVIVPEETHSQWRHGDGHFADFEAEGLTKSFGEARGHDGDQIGFGDYVGNAEEMRSGGFQSAAQSVAGEDAVNQATGITAVEDADVSCCGETAQGERALYLWISLSRDADVFFDEQILRLRPRLERAGLGKKTDGGVEGAGAQFCFGRDEDAIMAAHEDLYFWSLMLHSAQKRAEQEEFSIVRHGQTKTARAHRRGERRAVIHRGPQLRQRSPDRARQFECAGGGGHGGTRPDKEIVVKGLAEPVEGVGHGGLA